MKPFTLKDREELVLELFEKIRHLLLFKGKEYAGDSEDTLNNFTSRAEWLGMSRKATLFTDMAKHLDAIKEWAMNDHELTIEQAGNRIDDAIVYLILLKAMYRQEENK